MATKNNIRSIRFSDEMADLIDRQPGRTFTEKFEYLVTKCTWELPAKEKELETVKDAITKEQQELEKIIAKVTGWKRTVQAMDRAIDQMQQSINMAISLTRNT